jgi:hypothetical protein
MKIYRDRQQLIRPFFLGVSFSYISIDNIVTGPLRKYLIEFLKIGEFGSNMREEWLYYFILFLGVTQLYIALQSLFLPVIEIVEDKIVLRTRDQYLAVVKSLNEISDLKIDGDEWTFVTSDKSYVVITESLLESDLNQVKNFIESSRKID